MFVFLNNSIVTDLVSGYLGLLQLTILDLLPKEILFILV